MEKESAKNKNPLWKKLLVIIPIIAALLTAVILVKSKSGPEQKQVRETSRVMRVIEVPKVNLIPRAIGYGIAEPGIIWRAVAEVRGRVLDVHPDLKAGSLIKEGEVLLKINPVEYELSVARLQAGIDQAGADLAELEIRKQNTKSSLEIEKHSLLLAEQSLTRKQNTLKNKTISANEVDQEERSVLAQRQSVQQLDNTLKLIPSQKKALEAKLASSKAHLKQAELDLAKTVLVAPFNCRIGEVGIEQGQYLSAGQELFEAHSTAVTEIEAQFLGEQLRHLIGGNKIPPPVDMANIRKLVNIQATVRIQSGDWTIEWDARFDRIRETVDPDTRAFNIIVAVDKPYEKIIPGKRPPLTRGLFCEVELKGPPQRESIVIPRAALHEGIVFILNEENRLHPVAVTTAFVQSNMAIIESGLSGGETLIVSEPSPAITGMLVAPERDKGLEKRLLAEAGVKTVLK
ncbi:MAG: HlyD family efflux transporter periplasmic adaptor subunit [Desulfobulbaceae bacterium]|nr:HlyD family efflux transporter periplasmic adaptor subunit [Desulfobulbaceae bacterium]